MRDQFSHIIIICASLVLLVGCSGDEEAPPPTEAADLTFFGAPQLPVGTVTAGNITSVRFTLTNIGQLTADNIDVGLFHVSQPSRGQLVATSVVQLNPNESSAELTLSFTDGVGEQRYVLIIDPNDTILENTEANNSFGFTLNFLPNLTPVPKAVAN